MRSWLLIAVLFVGQVFVPTRASSLHIMSVRELTRQADLVVRGTVLSKSVQLDSEGRIYTAIRIRTSEVWKGEPSAGWIMVVHSGGILGQRKASVEGQVRYALGEEVVVFLVLNDRGEGVTVGMAQGKFTVAAGLGDRGRRVWSPYWGVMSGKDEGGAGAYLGRGRMPWTLAQLKSFVLEK